MRLRWKKDDPLRGLARIGSGPRGYTLHNGEKQFAHVSALGGGFAGPIIGWYWTCPSNSVGEYMNTYKTPAPDEATAKAQAMAFIKSRLAKIEGTNA